MRGRALLLCLSFAVGMSSAAAVSQYYLSRIYEVRSYSRKLDSIVRDGVRYDTLLLGTSRIENGVDEHCFDRENAQRGKETRTANVANSGLFVLESELVLDRALDLMKGHIKRVIFEPDFLNHY